MFIRAEQATIRRYGSNRRCGAALFGSWKFVASLCSAAFLLGGCSNLAGPAYKRPEAPVKQQWSEVKVSATETIRPDWWKNFRDAYLDELVQRSIDDNIDIKVAAARIGVAEATIGQARAAALPTVDAAVGANLQDSSDAGSSEAYSAGSAASWEIDVWGKLKKGVDAQKAELKATEADWRALYLTLVSNVSSTYFEIRQFDEQIDQLSVSIDQNERILRIYESLYREGVAPKTQVLQQKAEVARLKNVLLDFRRVRTLRENAVATLLGVPAGDLRIPRERLRGTVHLMDVPAGIPSDLLSRRPDIVAAEYRVLQAHNLVGQARLAKLPSFSLTGSFGNTSRTFSDLLSAWTVGLVPSIDIPIFDPNVNARLRVNEAQTRVVEEQYRSTVIRAFEEVENALVNLASRKKQKLELDEQLKNLRTISSQMRAQLAEGMISQLEVFETERSLLAAELALLQNHQLILSDTVSLYKALGGGWPHDLVGRSNI